MYATLSYPADNDTLPHGTPATKGGPLEVHHHNDVFQQVVPALSLQQSR